MDRILYFGNSRIYMGLINNYYTTIRYFTQIAEVWDLDYDWNIMCFDITFSFQFGQISIPFMVQTSNNAANWKRTTKVNSISYWLSPAQLETDVFFFCALRMHSLLHKSLFHGAYRLQRLTTFGFRITDTKNRFLVGRVWC